MDAQARQSGGFAASSPAASQPETWTSERNDTLEAPVLFGNRAAAPAPVIRRAWIDCLKRDPTATIQCHPDLALSAALTNGEPPLLHIRWDGDQATSVAVLINQPLRIKVAPGMNVWLSGYKLLESAIVGDPGQRDESVQDFREIVVELLRLGKAESIVIEDLVVGSPLWEALTTPKLPGVDVFHPHEPQPHWWIEFPQQPLQYWDKFSTRLRGKFRQRATRLGAVRCFRGVDQVPPFLAMAHEICANRRQARGSDLPVANSPRELAFWKLAAHHGGMRSYVLEHENRPVAFALAEQWNQRLVYRQIGYDQAYADYHPGQALLYRVLQDVIERDCPKVVDLGVGDVDDKGVFANQQVLTGPIVLVRSSWRPRAAMQMDLLRRKTSNALRAGLRHLGRLTRVRRLHRTKP